MLYGILVNWILHSNDSHPIFAFFNEYPNLYSIIYSLFHNLHSERHQVSNLIFHLQI
jgi:hypothetical protein